MLIKVGFEIAFVFPEPTAMLLMLYLHPTRLPTVRVPEHLRVEPWVTVPDFFDSHGNRCGRAVVPAGRVVFRNSAVVEDCGLPDLQVRDAQQVNVQDLPQEALPFLLASRYCEVDSELKELAWKLFSSTPAGWPRVEAVSNFVHHHIRFDYQQARATRTALDVYRERVGVCRDFMHLAVTFCRCLNIPARYCTGYLGDIGVPPVDRPMDFSAWFEAFLAAVAHLRRAQQRAANRTGADGARPRRRRRGDHDDLRRQPAAVVSGCDARGFRGGDYRLALSGAAGGRRARATRQHGMPTRREGDSLNAGAVSIRVGWPAAY